MAAPTQRFTARSRLPDPLSYQRVFRGATLRSVDPMFAVLTLANGLDHARLGLAITKKKAPKAVARNRLKRIVRESFRLHQTLLSGLDVVVMNQTRTETRTNAELLQSLLNHWMTLRAQCNKSSSS